MAQGYRGPVDTIPQPDRVGDDHDHDHDLVATSAGPPINSPTDDVPRDTDTAEGRALDGKDPLRFNNWMKRSATGAVMTGIAVGLQQALQAPRQEPAFVIEASGEPEDPDRPIDLHFDPDSPADTVAVIRHQGVGDPPDPPTGPP